MSSSEGNKETDKQGRGLRERILDIPPSGLKLDGNLNVRECDAIISYLGKKGSCYQ